MAAVHALTLHQARHSQVAVGRPVEGGIDVHGTARDGAQNAAHRHDGGILPHATHCSCMHAPVDGDDDPGRASAVHIGQITRQPGVLGAAHTVIVLAGQHDLQLRGG